MSDPENRPVDKKPRLGPTRTPSTTPSPRRQLSISIEPEDDHVDKKPRLESKHISSSTPPPRSQPAISIESESIVPKEWPAPSEASSTLLSALSDVISSRPAVPVKPAAVPMKPKKVKGKGRPRKLVDPFSKEGIVGEEAMDLLGEDALRQASEDETGWTSPYAYQDVVELTIDRLSSHGDALARAPTERPWAVVVPFALPGEVVKARIFRSMYMVSYADLVEIVKPNPKYRDDSRIKCKYFGECSGCQYQMLSYDMQLELKRDVIVRAYAAHSKLSPSSIPEIQPTHPSPLEYGYRTKITPHFELKNEPFTNGVKPDWLKIGFNKINTRRAMDIEECTLATPTLNEGMTVLFQNIVDNLDTYKRGASLLLRESLDIELTGDAPKSHKTPRRTVPDDKTEWIDNPEHEKKLAITDHKYTVRERIGDTKFEYNAGSFFQNNNAVLVPLTSYARDAIFVDGMPEGERPTHLVDAYCGSGLFALTLAPAFEKVAGIELSEDSIAFAKRNARLNKLEDRCEFHTGDAPQIFAKVQDFPRARTALVIDPPRKGCDDSFISQLILFGCSKVVYVSCNVHTQARDIGSILRKSGAEMEGKKYIVESIQGFDLFPQTYHVESVAVLRLVDA